MSHGTLPNVFNDIWNELLTYKSNRPDLLEKLKGPADGILNKIETDARGNIVMKAEDICPFTILYLCFKNKCKKQRELALQDLCKILGIPTPSKADLQTLPTWEKSWTKDAHGADFYLVKPTNIDLSWELFEVAIDLANGNSSRKPDFDKAFDSLLKNVRNAEGVNKDTISAALCFLRPDF